MAKTATTSTTRTMGVDFDVINANDFLSIGAYATATEKHLPDALDASINYPQFAFVFVPKSETNAEDLVCVSASGYTKKGTQRSILMFPARSFTAEDIKKIFKVEEGENGAKRYVPVMTPATVFGSVSYTDKNGTAHANAKDWTYKWNCAVILHEDQSEDYVTLSGEKRVFNAKDAEL